MRIARATVALVLALSWTTALTDDDDRATIALMGDTMLGRLVSNQIARRPADAFWGDTLPLLQQADLRILNLETTITTSDTPWAEWPKAFYYRAVPGAVRVLEAASIDYVNLANNHILDFSDPGMRETVELLDRAGIAHTGAGFSLEQAARPVTLRAGGLSVGVFSFADHYREWDAAKRGAGTFVVSIPPTDEQWNRVRGIITALREKHDLVVVSVHWGPNMSQAPSEAVVDFAHRLIDAGVDVIHGHSAHVFHGVEVYAGSVILYDTGEFIDDYAVDPVLRNDFSFLYLVSAGKAGVAQVELVPVRIIQMRVNLARGRDRERILRMFAQRTAPLGTRYRIVDGRVVITVD